MPRRRIVAKREILPDPKYGNVTLAKFMNHVMISGKKSVAERIVYGALDIVKDKSGIDTLDAIQEALDTIAPMVEVKSLRVCGATYQVPVEVKPARRLSLGIRWLVDAARSRSGMSIRRKLYQELLDASNGEGIAVKKKEDTHRMAEANRAFAHYRW